MIPNTMYNNPFLECTARDMEYTDVVNYWCQPYEYYAGLNEEALLSSATPIFIEGARGSGKTMLLKHLSYFCQKEESCPSNDRVLLHFKKTGSLGIYYRFKNDFGKLLVALNCNEDVKKELFEEYFQLYYSRELLLVLNDLLNISAIDDKVLEKIVLSLNLIFSTSYHFLQEFIDHINRAIENIDLLIRKLKYIGNISDQIAITVMGIPLVSKIFEIIKGEITPWNKITLLVLIDEYENISAFQKIVNSYVKQTDAESGITYRIGMRPEGIVTYSTNIADEQLQVGRDFLSMQLRVTNAKQFQKFLKIVAQKRLEKSRFFAENGLTKIEKILGTREDWADEARQAVKNRPRIIFDLIDSNFLAQNTKEVILEKLSFPDNPLIEMQNVLWINRGKSIDDTNHAMREYLYARDHKAMKDLDELGYKYYLDYDMKYKYALLFAILSKCGIRKKYYSFTTFSYLSCGSVNDFLSLCRNTFMALDSNSYNCLLKGKSIPPEIQDRGAQETASEQLDKIRLCEDGGTEMYTFVMNVGDVFSYYHRDILIQFPETNQFAFENEAEVESRQLLKRNLSNMIRWGVIEKKHNKQRISIGRRKGNLYYLNRLLAPIFGISYRTRGGYNFVIKTAVFEKMLSSSMDGGAIIAQNKNPKLSELEGKERKCESSEVEGQVSLFGDK